MVKKSLLLICVVLVGILFRLGITDKAWHVDMWSNASWGEWIHNYGAQNFYYNSIWTYSWPTQPPLINSIYAWNKDLHIEILGRLAWLNHQTNKVFPITILNNFVEWYGYGRVNIEIPFQIGYLITMKFLPILADALIALLLYQFSKKIVYAVAYLVSPFSWYVSALWGQYDGVGFACILTGLYLLYKQKFTLLVPALVVSGILIKPTALILAPFLGYYYLLRSNLSPARIISGSLIGFAVFWVTTQPYTHKNPVEFAIYDLKRIVFEKSEPRITTNAFNFWRIITGDKPENQSKEYLGITAGVWGQVVFVLITGLGIVWVDIKKEERWRLIEGAFIVSMASFVFGTGMLDRYAFAGVTLGLLVTVRHPRTWPLWILSAAVFWTNLYNQWWIPESWSWLQSFLLANNGMATRFLSLINTGVLVMQLLSLIKLPRWLLGNFRKFPFRRAVWLRAKV